MENLVECDTWSKENKWELRGDVFATLGGWSTDIGNSRQKRIDTVFDRALAAKNAGDMEAYEDYMSQIRNLDDESGLTK